MAPRRKKRSFNNSSKRNAKKKNNLVSSFKTDENEVNQVDPTFAKRKVVKRLRNKIVNFGLKETKLCRIAQANERQELSDSTYNNKKLPSIENVSENGVCNEVENLMIVRSKVTKNVKTEMWINSSKNIKRKGRQNAANGLPDVLCKKSKKPCRIVQANERQKLSDSTYNNKKLPSIENVSENGVCNEVENMMILRSKVTKNFETEMRINSSKNIKKKGRQNAANGLPDVLCKKSKKDCTSTNNTLNENCFVGSIDINKLSRPILPKKNIKIMPSKQIVYNGISVYVDDSVVTSNVNLSPVVKLTQVRKVSSVARVPPPVIKLPHSEEKPITSVCVHEKSKKNCIMSGAVNGKCSSKDSKFHEQTNFFSSRRNLKKNLFKQIVQRNKSVEKNYLKTSENASKTSENTNLSPLMKSFSLTESSPSEGEPSTLFDDATSSESEWEDVPDITEQNLDDYKPELPADGIEITIKEPSMFRNIKKKRFDVNEYIRLQINRVRKEVQLNMHQVHLLCLIGHGMHLNSVLNSDDVKAYALSLLPPEFFKTPKKTCKLNRNSLKDFVDWFSKTFTIDKSVGSFLGHIRNKIFKAFECQTASSISEYNLLFVGLARTLGLNVRLCLSFYPVSFKADDLLKKKKICGNKRNKSSEEKPIVITGNQNQKNCKNSKLGNTKPLINADCRKQSKKKSKNVKASRKFNHGNNVTENRTKRVKKRISYKMSSDDDVDDDNSVDGDFKPKKEDYSSDSDDGDFKPKREDYSSDSDDDDFKPKKEDFCSDNDDNGSVDGDFKLKMENLSSDDEPVIKRKRLTNSTKRSVKNPKANSAVKTKKTSSAGCKSIRKKGIECWVEVYSKAEGKWICVECFNRIFDNPYRIELLATQPISYVLAFDNESHIKDVTKRYCSQYMTSTRKLRIVPDWWDKTLKPFLPPNNKFNRTEDSSLDKMLLNTPIPTAISEFKNHPLYALRRHLLKFEALYPPDAPALGFIRGEPIYARECVHFLRSRDNWYLKEAQVVRKDEKPYKTVTQLKWDKVARKILKDIPLDLFGRWQTQKYVPPPAQNGKVPRNAYGNVELFQPGMLPAGTVHLQIPTLNRIAKKLEIDCPPAVVGFDIHNLTVHPVFDGFVVCEEFKDALLSAWKKEQKEEARKKEQKRLKRIYGNWKRLVRGLFIREKIKIKYMSNN